MPPDAVLRTGALIRLNTILLLREPGPLASRLVLPVAFLTLLHPLYQAAQGDGPGGAQAVIATLVTFSLLALSIAGGSILTERVWHTWERVRATAAGPAGLLTGKAAPVLVTLLAQQAIVIGYGAGVLGVAVASLPLVALAVLAWTLTLLAMGTALGVLARSFGELSAAYDVGGMILSSLGGALVPLAAMPHWVGLVAPGSPGYWAVSALSAALRGDAAGTGRACLLLLPFAAGFALLAVARLRRGWTRSGRI
ncbi:MAG TPA: ABC transporter permease [Streptosporangiaceae bacterium]|jgi:ABC-2 type transport system permease protein